jgi:hypothetical protein
MGYKLTHESKILTIFSSKAPYMKFDSAFLKMSQKDVHDIGDAGVMFPQFMHIV